MSNPFAIATVTTALTQLLARVTEESTLAGSKVTARPLDRARKPSEKNRQLNLMLYRVVPNAALQSDTLPFRDGNGHRVRRPSLAVELHYLLTAFGDDDDEIDGQHLLAHAMSLVHDNGILTRDQLRAAVKVPSPLASSDLADQPELVRLALQTFNVEEMSKLWSAFQTNYRLSVGYSASVVLIERPLPVPAEALPVREIGVQAVTIRRPIIDSLSPPRLFAGGVLAIEGSNLRGQITAVRFGDVRVTTTSAGERRLQVMLPPSLLPGVNTVQVVHDIPLGDPPVAHRGVESNVAPFVIQPRIVTPPPITVKRGKTLTLAFDPNIGRSQKVVLFIGDESIEIPPRPRPNPTTDPVSDATLKFFIPATFTPGTYLMRVSVDGVESQLDIDALTQRYNGPVVTVTA
jgi:hypothetical protein